MSETAKPFQVWCPVQTDDVPAAIPRALAERVWTVYAKLYGRDQTLDRMCERGGFGVGEALFYLSLEPLDDRRHGDRGLWPQRKRHE